MIDSQKKKYIISFLFVTLILIFVFGIIVPLFLAIKKDSAGIVSQKERLLSVQSKVASFSKCNQNNSILQSDIKKIKSFFIDPKEPLEFINFLEKTAQSLNLSIQIFAGSVSVKDSEIPSLSFQAKLSGSFNNLMKFLDKLGSADYLVEVESLNIQKFSQIQPGDQSSQDKNINDIQGNLNINVLSKP